MSKGLGSASGPCCRHRGGVREPERWVPARRAPVRRSVWVPALGGASGGPGCSPRPLSSRLLRGTGCPRTGQSCCVRGHSPDPGALCAPRWRPLPDPLAELNNCVRGEALQTMPNWKRGKKLDVRILRMRCLRFLSFQRNMDVTLCIEANDLPTRPGQHLRWEPTRPQHLPGLAVCWERGRVGSLWGAYCPPFSRRAGKDRAKACRGRAVVLGGGEAGRASRGSSL